MGENSVLQEKKKTTNTTKRRKTSKNNNKSKNNNNNSDIYIHMEGRVGENSVHPGKAEQGEEHIQATHLIRDMKSNQPV